jgi:quercetin dioxygenase-like cupin family protein
MRPSRQPTQEGTMSYPQARYSGDAGEASARYRSRAQPPELAYANGGSVHYLSTTATTGGEFGLYRWNFGPKTSGPDAHFHKTISESFYILSGTVRLYDGKKWVDAVEGDYLFVPEGGIHAFKNESGETASMLLLFAPGAPREEYFETLRDWGQGKTMSDDEKAEFFVRHDTYWPVTAGPGTVPAG